MSEARRSLIKKAYELEGKTKISAIIYGQPSAGKTALSLSAPNPLHIDFEKGSARIDPPALMEGANFAEISTYGDLINLMNDPELNNYDTLIFDTLGKLIDVMMAHVTGGALKQPRIQDWGTLKTLFSQLIKNATDSKNKNFIIIAHETEEKSAKGQMEIIVKRPKCSGSSWRDLVGDIDLMGYMQIGEQGERTISFSPTPYYYAKNSLNLPETIVLKNCATADENNFFTNVVMKRLQEKNVARKELGKKYFELVEEQEKIIDDITDLSTLNEAYSELQVFETINDSTIRWKKSLFEKSKELAAEFNKEANCFEITSPNPAVAA